MSTCRETFRNFSIVNVPSLFIFEVVSFVKDNDLIQAHQYNVNTSIETQRYQYSIPIKNSPKLFEPIPPHCMDSVAFQNRPDKLKKLQILLNYKTNYILHYVCQYPYYQTFVSLDWTGCIMLLEGLGLWSVTSFIPQTLKI